MPRSLSAALERGRPLLASGAAFIRMFHQQLHWPNDLLPGTWPICTERKDGRRSGTCPLVRDASRWNSVCQKAGVEIREDDCSPGKLCVAFNLTCRVRSKEQVRRYQQVLMFLLYEHLCIESVTLSRLLTSGHDLCFFEALRGNGGVRRLALVGEEFGHWGLCGCRRHLTDALSGLLNLRELSISEADLVEGTGMQKFVDYLANTTSLHVLDVTQSSVTELLRYTLYTGLLKNRSLKSLTLRDFYVDPRFNEQTDPAFTCLREHGTLESLTVETRCSQNLAVSLNIITRCVIANGRLRQLRLIGWTMDQHAATAIGQLFAGNCTLESFAFVPHSVATGHLDSPAQCSTGNGPSRFRDSQDGISSMLYGICGNRSLREVSFTLSCFTPNGCELLVAELLRNSSLRKITLEPERFDAVQTICQELRDKGHARDLLLPGRRDVAGTLLPPWVRDHTRCSRFVLDNSHMWRVDTGSCPRGIYVMPSFETVTSLCLREVPETFLNNGTCRLLAGYLARTTELRELNVTMTDVSCSSLRGSAAPVLSRRALDSLSAFVESLVANNGVTRVFLLGLPLKGNACKALARALRSGWCVYDLTLLLTARAICSFFSALTELPRLEQLNRSLTNLRVGNLDDRLIMRPQETSDLLRNEPIFVNRPPFLGAPTLVVIPEVVAGAVHRNCNVATLAAHYVTGKTADARCADALHQIARADRGSICEKNPGLVAKVQELALLDIDRDRACQMIKERVRCLLTLDGYMCAAGVVRRSVECYPHPKGQRQLPDVGHDAWAFIRRYLNVADVL